MFGAVYQEREAIAGCSFGSTLSWLARKAHDPADWVGADDELPVKPSAR
jgi:hypothetical protein